MMLLDKVKSMYVTNYNSEAWKLLERVVRAIDENGYEIATICNICNKEVHKKLKDGDRFIEVQEVGRHNGTSENVSVRIEVLECYNIECLGEIELRYRRVFETKVPKKASDKVINNRIQKVKEYL